MNQNAELSARETQVAELLAWGAAKKEVADRLNISTRTVENQARSIYEKLGIQKATELSVWWFCTKLGVSFDLNPLKRGIIAAFLLVLLLPSTIDPDIDTDMLRARRVEWKGAGRAARKGRRKDENGTFDLEF